MSIADTGPGLPADLGDRIFDPYVSTKETGSGLGLPICHQIVLGHGGRLTGENRTEGGAEFVVQLPLAVQMAPTSDSENRTLCKSCRVGKTNFQTSPSRTPWLRRSNTGNPMPKLLIVDDEANVRYSLEKSLYGDNVEIITAGSAKKGIELVASEKPDAVVLDVRLPDMSGLIAYERIREIDPRLPVILITAFATTETAIEAMKKGAFEYLLKPVDLGQLRATVAKAFDVSRLSRIPAVFEGGDDSMTADLIVGRSASMQDVYKAIGRVASQDVNVLVLGESGTGKELVARALFHHSLRNNKAFLAVNCAAIPEALLESQLFGHERGAFTGADRRRIGIFEQATGGTIFLDEIGDMTAATQAKVLRLLQDQTFERVGGNETITTDVRVISATNQNLEKMVAEGKFRQDLYYRLNVFTIFLPPLRERMDDLPLLVEHFIKQSAAQLGRHASMVAPETMQVLQQHTWPGNVRELQSAIKFALVHSRSDIFTPESLPHTIRRASEAASQPATNHQDEKRLEVAAFVQSLLHSQPVEIYDQVIAAVDRIVLSETLRHVKGNQVAAAELLGLSRNTLRAKLRSLGLSIEKQVHPENDGALH